MTCRNPGSHPVNNSVLKCLLVLTNEAIFISCDAPSPNETDWNAHTAYKMQMRRTGTSKIPAEWQQVRC